MGGKAQSEEEICLAHGIKYNTRGIRDVRKVANVGEGKSCALGEERGCLALQCSIIGDETKVWSIWRTVISLCCPGEIAEGIAHLMMMPFICSCRNTKWFNTIIA